MVLEYRKRFSCISFQGEALTSALSEVYANMQAGMTYASTATSLWLADRQMPSYDMLMKMSVWKVHP
jgi:hypothetical protein